jgi:hypothetical protein
VRFCRQIMKPLRALLLCAILVGCDGAGHTQKDNTKLIYFGFDDHSEKQQDEIALAKTWGGATPPCAHWRATINMPDADYRILFGDAETLTLVNRRGEVLYSGGEGVLSLPHGNPDGTGVNLCKLTGEP